MLFRSFPVLLVFLLPALAGCGSGDSGPKDSDGSGWHSGNHEIFAISPDCEPYEFGSSKDPRLCFVAQTIAGTAADGMRDERLLYGDEYKELFEKVNEAACVDMTDARLIPLGAIRQDFSCFVFEDGEVLNGDPIIFSAYFVPPDGDSPFMVNADQTTDEGIQEKLAELEAQNNSEGQTQEADVPPPSGNTPGPGPNFNQQGVMGEEFTPPDTPVPAGTANCGPGLSKVELDGQEMCISV